jgi:hypothetical protein
MEGDVVGLVGFEGEWGVGVFDELVGFGAAEGGFGEGQAGQEFGWWGRFI